MQINIYLMMLLVMMILVVLSVMISVAFLTLMERKILGYIQLRKGPNKLGVMGLVQPFSDAIKLLMKENNYMYMINWGLFMFSPILMIILVLMMWMIYPFISGGLIFSLKFLYLMSCLAVSVYGLILGGWSSNSMYAMLGAVRSLAQAISYEVSLLILLIIPLMFLNSMDLSNLFYLQKMGGWNMIFMMSLGLLVMLSFLAELNRTPFDFSEGESELVSGFNIEYSSVSFVLIFMGEYSMILFLSFMFTMFFLGGDYTTYMFYMKIYMISLMIIWIRGTLPRFRYDLLMYFCWLMILPYVLNYMIMMIYIKFYFFK